MNNLKNIIVFYPNSERGGVVKNLLNLTGHFTKFFNVYLITDKKSNKEFYFSKKIKFNLISKRKFFLDYRIYSSIWASIKLYNLIKKFNNKNTLIFSAQNHILSILVAKITGFKIVIRNSEDIIESTIHADNYIKSILIFFFKIIAYNFANIIITNSKKSSKSLSKIIFFSKKIKIIYNAYLLNIYKNQKKIKKNNWLLNVGRFCKQKNQKSLLKAFYEFNKNYNNNYKLVLIGDGYKKKYLINLSKELGIFNKIIFISWIDNLSYYYMRSKLLIHSSLYEGLPNVLIDSVNYELPVISTDVSGASDILRNNRGGIIIEKNNYKKLALSINNSLNYYSLMKNKILFAKKSIKRFLLSTQAEKYVNLLKNI
jgi:GalNAc-alpha-(1->4)-GalNAc-alpha-(1->3)-diNAcBac-PP-undecaprenol alpha-1,4-N-acetyl-D-galactosaminyltransferase